MKSFDELKKENGGFTLDGKRYILLESPYIQSNGQGHDHCWYEAGAISPDDQPEPDESGKDCIYPLYEVKWEILESSWAYWDNGNDYEGDAYDWEHPDSIREIGGYDMIDGWRI